MAAEDTGPADYALLESLFVDPDAHYSGDLDCIARVLLQSTCISSTFDLADPAGSHSLVIPDPVFPSEHDIQTTAAGEIIESVVGTCNQEEAFKLALESSFTNVRFLQAAPKLDLPSLRSDPRQDLKALARIVGEAKLHGFFFRPSTLPLEPVDDRKDEGIGMPSSAVHFHGQLTQGVEPDDLDFSEEDLLYVAESLYNESADEDLRHLINQEIESTIKRIGTMTPPLVAPSLSESDEDEVFVPDAEVCEIDNLSEPASLLSEDLELARRILNNIYDDPQLPDVSTSDIVGFPSDTPSFEKATPKHQEIDLEVPLFPKSDDEITNSQEKQAFRVLVESVPDFNVAKKGVDQAGTAIDETDSIFDGEFSILMKAKVDGMTRRLEQEQIETADAVARMQPPVLDFSTPPAEWQGTSPDPSAMLSWIRRNHKYQFQSSQWPKNPQEQRDLRWVPFPVSLAKAVDVKESVGDSRVLEQLFGTRRPGSLPTSADYVHPTCSLKILSPEDEEELPGPCEDEAQELGLYNSGDDIMDLIRKYRLAQTAKERPLETTSSTRGLRSPQTANHGTATHFLGGGLLLGEKEADPAGKMLASYMDLRGAKRQKTSTGSSILAPTTSTVGVSNPPMLERATQNAPKPRTPQPERQTAYAEAPCPPIDVPKEAPRIVISVSLPRCVISALQATFPGIDLVDRDFARHNTWFRSPGSARPTEVQSPLSYEADIIPSPATGIVITTILKVRQKPLPGSKDKLSQVRQRLARVAPLYERVVVLVSEGNPVGEQVEPLNATDAEAYTSFVAFGFSLGRSSGCSLRVMYVAGGSQTLARWACALVAMHAREAAPDVQQILMAEETEWEVFLRRAGFNMYAAQVALAVVKGAYPDDEGDSTLVRLLGMGPKERASLLRGFLGGEGGDGGRNLVDRVNARLG
ncbi:uncharacterized protein LY79DRAFT_578769 [Colletotrichum navitas]|uniref:Uncharacterized protein n=1 Tax=Colletotrichum navitas TaxID=681940 RepID=A0AAD8Q2B4_9PEZI|nr:uncharacterized protein LY79DRAFT_578769 [Colletotrichum navitas]KAK1594130.1 hypothetical protein LY79DRAFT_578769 [Colletotrichum navitas]